MAIFTDDQMIDIGYVRERLRAYKNKIQPYAYEASQPVGKHLSSVPQHSNDDGWSQDKTCQSCFHYDYKPFCACRKPQDMVAFGCPDFYPRDRGK